MSEWHYQGMIITDLSEEIHKDNMYGFIYEITNVPERKVYIGQKAIFTRRKNKLVESWKNYYGSSLSLKEDIKRLGRENFRREILRFVGSKAAASYYETKEILERDALLRSDYYNKWLSITLNANTLTAEAFSK